MPLNVRTIEFPKDKSLGLVHLINSLDPGPVSQATWKVPVNRTSSIDFITLGPAMGTYTIPLNESYYVLLEPRGDWRNNLDWFSCLKPNDIDIIENLINDEQIAAISRLTGLKCLPFTGQKTITDEGARHIGKITELRYLQLARTSITSRALEYIGQLRNLECLYIGDTAVKDLSCLSKLLKLQRLDIRHTAVDDDNIAHLAELPELERLFIGTKVTDIGLTKLECMSSLKWLYTTELELGDSGLQSISKMTGLEQLGIASTKWTSAGLQSLTELKNLESLSIGSCNLPGGSCKITYEDVYALLSLPRLSKLSLNSVSPPKTDIDKIQKELPHGWKCQTYSAGYVEPRTSLSATLERV